MLKKKYNFQKQLLIKYNYKRIFIMQLLTGSLLKNHYVDPLNRLSFLAQNDYVDDLYYKYSTYQKLLCLISLCPKVHNKSYNYSRFFLNKQLEKLVISNTLK